MDQKLLRKYLRGDCTEEEKHIVEAFLVENPESMSAFRDALEADWEAPGSPDAAGIAMRESLHHELVHQLFHDKYPETAKVIDMTPGRAMRRWITAAAAACLLITSLGALWMYRHQWVAAPVQAAVWKTLRNTGTVQQTAVLPDNTRIWLNPGSELDFAMGSQRSIRLMGEAFFDVARDPARPFVVAAGAVTTRVLGTAFNIEAYPGEAGIRVSLVSGIVSVQSKVMRPGQSMVYDIATGRLTKSPPGATHISDWTGNQIVFKDVPLTDALTRLANRFHLQLAIDARANLTGKRFSSTFKNESTDEMLKVMLFTADCSFTRKADHVSIHHL